MATAKSGSRVYRVTDMINNKHYLVKATNKAQAITYVVDDRFDAALPTVEELFALAKDGVEIQDAVVAAPVVAVVEAQLAERMPAEA